MQTHRKGMTMVEVTTALSITAVIGLVAGGVTYALFDAHESTEQYVENVQSGRVSLAQIERLIRSSRLVTAADAHTLVLWRHDPTHPGVIDSDEVTIVRFDPSTGSVTMSKTVYPDNLPAQSKAALNAPLDLSDVANVADAAGRVGDGPYAGADEIACGISSLRFRCTPAPPETKAVSIKAVFGQGPQAITLHGTATVRASAAKWVAYDNGSPHLVMPAEKSRGLEIAEQR